MLKYRENNYFNSEDFFIIKNNLGMLLIDRAVFYNGNWFHGMYKLTSVECVNLKELVGFEVCLSKSPEHRGELNTKQAIKGNIGVIWKQGLNYNKIGLPNYWQELSYNIKIKNIYGTKIH